MKQIVDKEHWLTDQTLFCSVPRFDGLLSLKAIFSCPLYNDARQFSKFKVVL